MDDKLLQIFAEESWELIEALEEGLVSLEQDADPEKINEIFRAAHTMKGNAGIVGFSEVLDLTHIMEGVLDEMRQGRRQPEPRTVDLLLSAVDSLKEMITASLDGSPSAAPPHIIAELANLCGTAAPAPAPPHAPQPANKARATSSAPLPETDADSTIYKITMRFQRDLFGTGNDPLLMLLELGDLGKITQIVCHSEGLPAYDRFDPSKLYLWWELLFKTTEPKSTLENVFIFVQDDNEISIEPTSERSLTEPKPQGNGSFDVPGQGVPGQGGVVQQNTAQPTAPPDTESYGLPMETEGGKAVAASRGLQTVPTIRVDTGKLDKLVNMVGELVIGVARISQLTGGEEFPELDAAMESLSHITRELQEQVMRVRMVPVESTFNRFQRMVRDLASELGKKIRLEMHGTETELDKNVIEQIADPLKHLIRNSADHGLELPQERTAAGKPETGTISLSAYQQEGRIIIEVADDGKGLDRDAILQKAIGQGLAQPHAQLNDNELFSYVFMPGFSTAQNVTEVSGRGVGLDVVKKNIESLSGSLEIDSRTGQGTTFRVKLPLTLAIIDGMMVQVGEEILTLPLLSILESIRPRPEDVKTVEGQGELIAVREEYLPLVRLHEIMDLPTDCTDPCNALVVIIETVGRHFGILVDDILGEQQAVIKSLEQNYHKVDGVAGATILGDGRISLILDIHGLEKLAFA